MVGDGIYKKGVNGRQKNHHLNNKIHKFMQHNEVIAPKELNKLCNPNVKLFFGV
jgi:hypothetical protein